MKFTCNRDLLTEALNIVSKAVPGKSNNPVLEGFLIEVNEDLNITGSDGDISISYQVGAIVEEIGSVVVSAKIFSDIVRKLPDVYVTVETSQNSSTLTVNSGASHFEIQTINSEQYPKVNYLSDCENDIELPCATLRTLIKQTSFAASIDSAKMILRGVLIEKKNDLIKFAAVDGLKLAVKSFPIVYDNDFSIVVPSRVLNEISKIIDRNDESIHFCFNENQIMFYNGTFKILSSLLKGDFPDYEKLIPAEFSTVMSVPVQEFTNIIERVGVVIDDDKKWPIVFKTYPDEVFISVAGENGSSNEILSAEISGQEIEIFFNLKILLECLRVIEKDKICFNFSSQKGPCVINSEDDDSYLLLVMPVKPRTR